MLLCFDLDGTLEDSRRDMVGAIQRLRSELNLGFRDYDALVPWVSKGMPKLYANAFDDVIDSEIRDALPELYAEQYAAMIVQHTCLYDGIHSMLQSLHGSVPMAVVTNKPEVLSRLLLTKLDVLQYFSAVIGGDTFDFAKPNPGMLSGAVEQSGLRGTEQCVMVGDSAGDIRMAHAYGAQAVWCQWGYYESLADVEPDVTVKTPDDVVKHVRTIITGD